MWSALRKMDHHMVRTFAPLFPNDWHGWICRCIFHTCPNLWYRLCSKRFGMVCLGTPYTHAQTHDNVRVLRVTCIHPSVHLPIHLSIYPSIGPWLHLSNDPTTHPRKSHALVCRLCNYCFIDLLSNRKKLTGKVHLHLVKSVVRTLKPCTSWDGSYPMPWWPWCFQKPGPSHYLHVVLLWTVALLGCNSGCAEIWQTARHCKRFFEQSFCSNFDCPHRLSATWNWFPRVRWRVRCLLPSSYTQRCDM